MRSFLLVLLCKKKYLASYYFSFLSVESFMFCILQGRLIQSDRALSYKDQGDVVAKLTQSVEARCE